MERAHAGDATVANRDANRSSGEIPRVAPGRQGGARRSLKRALNPRRSDSFWRISPPTAARHGTLWTATPSTRQPSRFCPSQTQVAHLWTLTPEVVAPILGSAGPSSGVRAASLAFPVTREPHFMLIPNPAYIRLSAFGLGLLLTAVPAATQITKAPIQAPPEVAQAGVARLRPLPTRRGGRVGGGKTEARFRFEPSQVHQESAGRLW